jgi:hypothetical protein
VQPGLHTQFPDFIIVGQLAPGSTLGSDARVCTGWWHNPNDRIQCDHDVRTQGAPMLGVHPWEVLSLF